jgi:hypothetical protein
MKKELIIFEIATAKRVEVFEQRSTRSWTPPPFRATSTLNNAR